MLVALLRLSAAGTMVAFLATLLPVDWKFVWMVSIDPIRYRPFVWFTAVMNIVFGAMMIAIDLHAGMPGLWTAIEGPAIMALGLAIAGAARARVRAS